MAISLVTFLFSPSQGDDHPRDTGDVCHERQTDAQTSHEHTAALIASIRAGDMIAFERLFRDYFPRLVHHARLLVGSTDLAEELTQEVFWSIWERRASWTVRGTLATYLHSAIHHRAQRHLRDDQRRARILTQAFDPSTAPLMTPPALASQGIEHEELVSAVRRAIEALPKGRQLVITLRWDEGLSYAEIAAVTGTSVKAVENQLNRTLHQLRQMLVYLRP